jgi:hypothetical protein
MGASSKIRPNPGSPLNSGSKAQMWPYSDIWVPRIPSYSKLAQTQ